MVGIYLLCSSTKSTQQLSIF